MTKPTTDEELAELREQVANNMADAVVPGLIALIDQGEQRVRWLLDQRDELESQVEVLLKRVRELEKDKSDYIETVYNCLVAAGAPEDIDEQERVLPQHGTKPSHFVAAMIRQARRDALREAARNVRGMRDELNTQLNDSHHRVFALVLDELDRMAGGPKCDT